ncbi:MAG TPA: sulfotransferase [Flavobacteriaceae bacterium]|nr:sulfotransferase [Flavobacteriaceae bacterium]
MNRNNEKKEGFPIDLETPIFFIVGRGRSGSTLLQMMLDAHPNIQVPLESRFVVYLYKKYAHQKVWSQTVLKQFIVDLSQEKKINLYWDLDWAKLEKNILAQPENTSFAKLCKLVYCHHISFFPKSEILLIGDKNPINSVFVPQLMEIFPDAKFIHLVRDPRANICSHLKSKMETNLGMAALKWVEFNKYVEKVKLLRPKNYFLLRYEDFVSDPEIWLKEITCFLQMEFRSEMLEYRSILTRKYQSSEKDLRYELFSAYHQNLQKPVNKNLINNWKAYFSKEEIGQIEGIVHERMLKYDYIPATDNIRSASFREKLHFLYRMKRLHAYYESPLFVRTGIAGLKNFLKPNKTENHANSN